MAKKDDEKKDKQADKKEPKSKQNDQSKADKSAKKKSSKGKQASPKKAQPTADQESDKQIIEVVKEEIEPDEAKEIKFVNNIELTGDRKGEYVILNLYQSTPIATEETDQEIKFEKEKRLINRIAVTGPQALRTAENIENRLQGPRTRVLQTIRQVKEELETGMEKQLSTLRNRQVWLGIGILIIVVVLALAGFTASEEILSLFG